MHTSLSLVNTVAVVGGAMVGALTLLGSTRRSIDRPGLAASPALMAVCVLAGMLTGLSHWRAPDWVAPFTFGLVSAAGSLTLAIGQPPVIGSRADAARYVKRASLSLAANVVYGAAFALAGLIVVRGVLRLVGELL
jgi:hypothetical protein